MTGPEDPPLADTPELVLGELMVALETVCTIFDSDLADRGYVTIAGQPARRWLDHWTAILDRARRLHHCDPVP